MTLKPDAESSPRHISGHLIALALYSVLAILVTFPLVLVVSSQVPKDLGDPLLTLSILGWNAEVLPFTDRWWNGFGFFPVSGMMAFSDHFLGAGLIATPLQWVGCSALTAYNLTLLASFPLCALSAHFLAFALTRRHDAAVVCGLAYGFNPYRVAHLEHLELLLAFGLPAALAALHQYSETRRARWLIVFSSALAIQAYSASYYALFSSLMIGLWVAWFVRPRNWRDAVSILGASCASALLVAPVVIGYLRIHETYRVSRYFAEVLMFSADFSSLLSASPLSAVWGWTGGFFSNGGERQLFPGLAIAVLAALGAVVAIGSRDRLVAPPHAARVLWMASGVFAAIAVAARLRVLPGAPSDWLEFVSAQSFKPLTVAIWLAAAGIAASSAVTGAFRTRSKFGFYLLATVILFLCCLGPNPGFLGDRVLWKAPYAVLMKFPFFSDTVRVPARFAMFAILSLSVAAALAFDRLTRGRKERGLVALLAGVAVVADGWTQTLPLAAPPRGFPNLGVAREAPILKLPLGDVWRDTATMYRARLQGRRSVNGYNGFVPSYYEVLRMALTEHDPTVLTALTAFGEPLVVAVPKGAAGAGWAQYVSAYSGITRTSEDARWTLFQLAPRHTPDRQCRSRPLPLTSAVDGRGRIVDVALLNDGRPDSRWITILSQRPGQQLTLALGRLSRVCDIVVSMGSEPGLYPRLLTVSVSPDGKAWTPRWTGPMGAKALLSAIENPRDSRFVIPLGGALARFVRLEIDRSDPHAWAVADVVVNESEQSAPIAEAAGGELQH